MASSGRISSRYHVHINHKEMVCVISASRKHINTLLFIIYFVIVSLSSSCGLCFQSVGFICMTLTIMIIIFLIDWGARGVSGSVSRPVDCTSILSAVIRSVVGDLCGRKD